MNGDEDWPLLLQCSVEIFIEVKDYSNYYSSW